MGVLFCANSLKFPISMTSLVCVSLQELKGWFVVLAPKDHHYASATMESMLWRMLTVSVTRIVGSSLLPMVDSIIGRLETLCQSLLSRSNCSFLFLGYVIFEQIKL